MSNAPLPIEAITAIASASSIARYQWRNRGRAPAGYINGMAVAYATVCLKLYAGDSAAREMAKANSHLADKDALSWYAGIFDGHGLGNDADGISTLRHLFVLLLGLGMRESSGRFCEGRDRAAKNVSADTAEAGLFQMSWNAHRSSGEIPKLFEHYSAAKGSDLCARAIFAEGVKCSAKNLENYGTGKGRQFQELCKTCPQFAVESAGVGLRHLRKHWGPINRREAEVRVEADEMFFAVQELIAPPTT